MDHAAILQRLHDSEINWMLSCFYDGEFRWAIGGELNGWKHVDKASSAREAVVRLAETAYRLVAPAPAKAASILTGTGRGS
jgi:hypothetical protein